MRIRNLNLKKIEKENFNINSYLKKEINEH